MSEFKLKNGMKLYYEDYGSGQPVIMMHGWGNSHEVYSEPVALLKDKARFIIYDYRGHSGSKEANKENVTMETLAGDLHEIIEGLALSDVTLVGWSMGAGVAMNYIRLYGCSALKQIVLCDMSPKQLNDREWKLGMYLHKAPGFFLGLILKKRLENCDKSVLKSLSDSMNTQDNRDGIGKITVPLTYFYAVPGSLFSPKLAEWYKNQANVPFKSVAFPESTHMFISEHPEQFAMELGKLL